MSESAVFTRSVALTTAWQKISSLKARPYLHLCGAAQAVTFAFRPLGSTDTPTVGHTLATNERLIWPNPPGGDIWAKAVANTNLIITD